MTKEEAILYVKKNKFLAKFILIVVVLLVERSRFGG